ncbi:MAG: helix-turn-helix transcriptional regulator [Sinobacterium sp.]|nr:helix-turn-helix transcriptional regulator [Sinobacterium sp.]
MDNEFGRQLKMWRKRLNVSQQTFCLEADISTKHLSYLETGKSQPSLQMVEKIADYLEMSTVDRSMLIHAAGFEKDNLLELQRQDIHCALKKISDRHEPYPSVIADIHLKPLFITQGTVNLLQWLGLDYSDYDNSLALVFSTDGMRQYMPDWEVTAAQVFQLTKAQQPSLGTNSQVNKNLQGLLSDPELSKIWQQCSQSYGAILPIIPYRIVKGEQEINISMIISTFGLPKHLHLSEHEYQINAFYPDDENSRLFLESLSQ